jgi:hypothetical protein
MIIVKKKMIFAFRDENIVAATLFYEHYFQKNTLWLDSEFRSIKTM